MTDTRERTPDKDRRRFLVSGYSGAGNMGDELMLASLLWLLRHEHPGAGLCVISFDPQLTREIHDVPSVSTRTADVLEALRVSDTLILGPGGIFHDAKLPNGRRHQSGISFYASLAHEAAATGRNVACLGVGLGPLTTPTARSLVNEVAVVASSFVVRDEASATLVDRDVMVAPDLAWSVVPSTVRAYGTRASCTIAVACRMWGSDGENTARAESIAAALDAVLDADPSAVVSLVAMEDGAGDDDSRFASDIQGRMCHRERTTIDRPENPQAAIDLIAGVDVVLAMRFHGTLLGLALGVPTVAIAYDDKVRSLMTSLGRADDVLGTNPTTPDIQQSILRSLDGNAWRSTVIETDALRTETRRVHGEAIRAIPMPNPAPAPPSRLRMMRHRYLNAIRIRSGR